MLSPGAAALDESAGPIEAQVTAARVHNCVAEVTNEFCPIAWDPGSDQTNLSDDNVSVTQTITQVNVSIEDGALGLHREVVFNESNFTVENPGWRAANGTWIEANDSLPHAVKEHVTLESRELWENGYAPHSRGLVVRVRFPTPVPDPYAGDTWDSYSLRIASWDCAYYFTSEGGWDKACSYDSIRPFPHGVWQPDSIDWQLELIRGDFDCSNFYVPAAPESCAPTNATGAEFGGIETTWKDKMPDVGLSASAGEVAVELTPSRGSSHDTSLAPLAVRSAENATLPGPLPYKEPSKPQPLASSSQSEDPAGHPQRDLMPPKPVKNPSDLHPQSTQPPAHPWIRALALGLIAGGALAGALLGLYHRLAKEDTLENKNRQRVYEEIKKDPGVRAGTLSTRLGLNYATVSWHLSVLRECHLIEGTATGDGQLRYFLNGGSYSASEKKEILACAAPTAKLIFEHIRKRGPMRLADLASELGIAKSTVSEIVSRLERSGLVAKRRSGNAWHISLPATDAFPSVACQLSAS